MHAEFINYGDKKDITNETMAKLFGGELDPIINATSCAFKHILAYEKIVKNNIDVALILEDDIYLSKDFDSTLTSVLNEINENQYSNFIVSLEDSNLQFVKRSELVKNKFLYKKLHGRLTGAYLIDKLGAYNCLEEIKRNKCNRPIDWFHNESSEKQIINIFWINNPIATQGSLMGTIKSLIDDKPYNFTRIISFKLQKIYKTILYNLR